jgi:DNA-cytosine methyltransferase
MKPLTAISLFSGAVDGLAIAARAAGIHVTHHVEWDVWCCRVLRMNHPNSIVLNKDIHDVHELPPTDIIFGGSPCQGWSAAGSRKGFDDPRYLWPEMLRIVRTNRPRIVIHENVRGGVSSGLLDRISDDLEDSGYETTAFVFPANVFGAPHERYRMFVVGLMADTGSQRRPEPGTQPDTSADQKQHVSPPEREGRTVADEAQSGGEDVVNASQSGRGEYDLPRIASDSGHTDRRPDEAMGDTTCQHHADVGAGTNAAQFESQPVGSNRSSGEHFIDDRRREMVRLPNDKRAIPQSRLGGNPDGVASGLHRFDPLTAFPGFPAGQGVYQHAYEPPRTTPAKGEYANDRVQALGNAVVWQQAAPVFRTAVKWLEATMDIRKGDGLVMFNGARVIATGPVFKMNSIDPNYYCVPVDYGDFQLPVDIRGVVEVWRDGQPATEQAQQLELFDIHPLGEK